MLHINNIVPTIQRALNGARLHIINIWNNVVNWVVGVWNNARNMLGRWINTGVNVASGGIGWAITQYNHARNIIGNWINTGVNVATGAIDWARARWNDLRNFVLNNPIVGTVRRVLGFGPVSAPAGPPSAPFSMKYQNYEGHRKDAWSSSGTCLTGNCVDMTLGLMRRYGGGMITGTWNGNPHVWWRSPSGEQLDPDFHTIQSILKRFKKW